MKCMHMISRDRGRSEGWGSTAVWNLSENSSNLVASPFPYVGKSSFIVVFSLLPKVLLKVGDL